jgi:hypothetical protein
MISLKKNLRFFEEKKPNTKTANHQRLLLSSQTMSNSTFPIHPENQVSAASFAYGVSAAILGSVVSNLGVNIQKYSQTKNAEVHLHLQR